MNAESAKIADSKQEYLKDLCEFSELGVPSLTGKPTETA
jgi:hypothetical protein